MKNKFKMDMRFIVLGCMIGILVDVGIIFWHMWQVTPLCDSFVVELGRNVSLDPNDYFAGREWSVEKAEIDISEVVLTEPGSYFVYGRHGLDTYTYTVLIQDTTPPEIKEKNGTIYLQAGIEYTPYDLIDRVTDISGSVDLRIQAEGQDSNTLTYEETGTYTAVVKATDPSGNMAESQVTFLVDTAPEITGMLAAYVTPGSVVSLEKFTHGLMAYDEVDGELTEKILIDTSAVDWNTEGDYKVVYSVADGYGLVGVSYSDVHILSADRLQEAINTHQINRFDQIIEGAYNLYDSGYYEEDDPKLIMETMEPTFVRIYPSENSFGSGFIIEITDDSVIICTNQHVTTNKKTVEVYFHNGFHAQGNVVAAEVKIDTAFVEVPFNNITQELLDSLMTVHIDMEYWESLENQEPLTLCVRTINEKGSVWRDRTGTLAQKMGNLPEFAIGYRGMKVTEMTEVNLNLYHGSSGSAILDGHGYLIAMTDIYTYDENRKTRQWGVPLRYILNYYEEVMGRPANYR